ncbi:hypothetical protein J4E93_008628 [Alternaria ventricosa]|uniref:uncharacterized protein n=1 Tax=Alternaria ventricosa TaxID=1187951 RepID=UPI0020C436FD|nr:uncharacterized protein J4E93_008628 [Alternaria ventricosa]KAI4640422.1 hypothetical protein J4E93_008628 [Alternaria ventricosa]
MTTKPVLSNPQLTAITAADLAFEREKAAITSYEEGWDRWDGPIYPIGFVQCRMPDYFRAEEDGYVAPSAIEEMKAKGVEVTVMEVSEK